MFSVLSITLFLSKLFPTTGFQIITEPRSTEDFPCPGSHKLSVRPLQTGTMLAISKHYFGGIIPGGASQFLEGSKPGGTWGKSSDQRLFRQNVSKHIKASSPSV